MERIWLKSYPEGVPAEVDVDAFSSIVDMFEKSVTKFADRPAYVHMGATLTYAEVDRLSRDFAAFLREGLKLPRGARVALMMPNVLQYPIALFGALRGGYVVVNCNPLYTARELERQLVDCGAEAVLVLENFANVLQQALPRTMIRHVITTQLGDMLGWGRGALINFFVKYVKKLAPKWSIANAITFTDALRRGASLRWRPDPIAPHDIAFLQYTGGTTGVPKGAMLTHRNIVANLQQHHAQIGPALTADRDIVITALPLFHIYALTVSCLLAVKIGAANVLITNPRDIRGLVKELGKAQVHLPSRRQYSVQGARRQPGFRAPRLFEFAHRRRGWSAATRGGGEKMESHHRNHADRSLWLDGDVSRCDLQSSQPLRIQWLLRRSHPLDRDHDPR